MHEVWEENKGCIITIGVILVIFMIFVAHPYQLDALFAMFTPGAKNRVAVRVDDVIRMNIRIKPTEWLKQYSDLIAQKTGVTPDEATDMATEAATFTQGGLVLGTVVASELPMITPGQQYVLLVMYPIPKSDTLICNYEPDVQGYIFYPKNDFGDSKPVYLKQGDDKISDFFKSGARKIIIANAELRQPGIGDRLFLREAKKPPAEAGNP